MNPPPFRSDRLVWMARRPLHHFTATGRIKRKHLNDPARDRALYLCSLPQSWRPAGFNKMAVMVLFSPDDPLSDRSFLAREILGLRRHLRAELAETRTLFLEEMHAIANMSVEQLRARHERRRQMNELAAATTPQGSSPAKGAP